MSQKQVKRERNPKYSVKQVLQSIHWSVESNKLQILSTITDEFVTIDISAIQGAGGAPGSSEKTHGKAQ